MNKRIVTALLAAGALTSALPAAAEIVLFGRDNFDGRSVTLQQPTPDLGRGRLNDRASSAIVYGRAFEVCEHAGFRGDCRVLQPGRYPNLGAMGLGNSISSVRPLRAGARYDRDRYAPAPSYPVYDVRRRKDERLYEAEVVHVRGVYGQPQQRCWVERQAVAESPWPRGGNEIGGAVIGGILGGVLGHQVGSGRGNDLATGVGAIAGALAGANVARNNTNGGPAYTQDVRRCTTGAPSGPPEYYDVTYRFRGQEHRMQTTTPPPPTITVNGRGEPRVG
jgi:uncharacterized protein YcfJ